MPWSRGRTPPPWPTEFERAAALRIADSVGPTQGVQAIANAAPATNGPPVPARAISRSGRQSRLSRGTNGVSRKKTPSAMIVSPAIRLSVSRWSASDLPMPVAVMPSATKITVNDRQKSAAGQSTRAIVRGRPSCISATDTPLTADR
jgi:hypothetical protein